MKNIPDNLPYIMDLASKRWRLQNLYRITDKSGAEIQFRLNWMQEQLLDGMWYQMLILKARQLGCTTFFAINFLDDCFWHSGMHAGIIADKMSNSEDIFKKKVKYAYDRMPEWTRFYNSATNDRAGELSFANGSSFRVSTGFRSGTYQRLLISEFGKICAKSPNTAKEIVTGSLNTVSRDQIVVIESTAEGREGYFYDFAREAEALKVSGKKISPMQMRFFFFPWYEEPSYRERNSNIVISREVEEYMEKIAPVIGKAPDEEQKAWYQLKLKMLGESIKSEYPSTPAEAFESSNQGLWYGEAISKLRAKGCICRVPYNEYSPVHTAWDIGLDDHTAIWCFQLTIAGEIRLIDYYENLNEGAKHYVDWLMSRGYKFGTHLLPHDAEKRNPNDKVSYVDTIRPILQGDCVILERGDIFNGIQYVRSILSRCVFDESRCSKGIQHLENYRKIWDDKIGGYKNAPFHNEDSHGADAFRYMAVGLPRLSDYGSNLEQDYKALRAYWGG